MSLPKKRTRPRSGIRDNDGPIRCPSHLAFVRFHECAVKGVLCWAARMEAAHVRSSGEGGVGIKPGDNWTIPLCAHHHREQHQIGESAFERRYRIDMKAIAEQLWKISPAGQRWRAKHQQETQTEPAQRPPALKRP